MNNASGTKLVFPALVASHEVNATPGTAMNIVLETTVANLNEVVVMVMVPHEKDVTGSIVSLQAKEFNKGVMVAPDQLIQGKTPGVMVINNTGQPEVQPRK